ncbi:hypothetical protein C8J57DRAFT_1467039 [Mycena rebaudengoi]|nr:hypothetical protein C8J57DRAFT_1467039 [Mycena rebaudengoi]
MDLPPTPESEAPNLPHIPVIIPDFQNSPNTTPVPPDLNETTSFNIPTSDENGGSLEAEDSPAPEGVVKRFLEDTLKAVDDQIHVHQMPDCYRVNKSFWIEPPNRWFALQQPKSTATPVGPIFFTILGSSFGFQMCCFQQTSCSAAHLAFCNDEECMYHDKLLAQLPVHLQNEFPAFLTHRSGIDKNLVTLLRSGIAQGLTSHAWSRILRELHVRNRDLAELSYLHALKTYPCDELPQPLPVFSSFSDKNGFAGFSPSRWYLNQIYVDYMGYVKPHQDQAMAALPATLIRWDRSYKIIITISNAPLQGTARSLHEHGHPPMSLLWTDNVAADPSTIHLIDEACLSIMADVGDETSGKIIVVGFSLEWDWRASEAGHFPAAMMQISWQNTVNLLQIYLVQKPQQVPESLKALLLSKRVIKVGYHVQGNLDLLSMLWELRSSPDQRINTRATGWVDIDVIWMTSKISVAPIGVARIFRLISGCTRLETRGFLSKFTRQSLIALRPEPRLSRMGLPGEKVTLRNGDINVAHGIFAVQPTKIAVSESDPDTKYITISRTKRAVITIQQILAQSFISHYHQRSLEDMGPPPFDMAVDLVSLIAREEYTMQNQPGLLSQTNPAPMDVDSTSVKPPEFGDSVSEMDWEAGSELRL